MLDTGDGLGEVRRTGAQLLIFALKRRFPDNLEAMMLRAGLEFFSFQPSPGESVLIVFLRFDTMLEKANSMANLSISYPFRSWMLLSLLRITPKKWADYLKEMGHRFPQDEIQYKLMQDNIVREKTLETQVGQLGGGGNNYIPGDRICRFVCDDPFEECLPLYLCLGQPTAGPPNVSQTTTGGQAGSSRFPNVSQTTTGGLPLENGGCFNVNDADFSDTSSDYSDEESWARENKEDPYDPARLAQEQNNGKDPEYRAQLYWAKRVATRRYRAATGRFKPRKAVRHSKIAKRFTRRGPSARHAAPRKGFYIEDVFVSLEHVSDEKLMAFFQKRMSSSRPGTGSKDQLCFNCGKGGHFSKECTEAAKCFNCGLPGHRKADCPKMRVEAPEQCLRARMQTNTTSTQWAA